MAGDNIFVLLFSKMKLISILKFIIYTSNVRIGSEQILGSRGLADQATHYQSPKTLTITACQ